MTWPQQPQITRAEGAAVAAADDDEEGEEEEKVEGLLAVVQVDVAAVGSPTVGSRATSWVTPAVSPAWLLRMLR